MKKQDNLMTVQEHKLKSSRLQSIQGVKSATAACQTPGVKSATAACQTPFRRAGR
jgi:hypothetical protein